MPQASTRTLTEFHAHFGKDADDTDALKYLAEKGIPHHRGMIQVTDDALEDDERLAAACWYLAEEWDFSF